MSTVVITGANRGLGLALATQYAKDGATVIGGCRRPAQADALRDLGAEVLELDTASEDSIAAFGRAIGDRPVDVLYNNAGIDARAAGAAETERGPLSLTAQQYRSVIDVNVVGPLLVVQALAANVQAAEGIIVNITSQVGSFVVGQRMGSDVAYTSSKSALNMLTVKQAGALRPLGVRVIALHPGWVRSEMGGPRATLDPTEAAASIHDVVERLTMKESGQFFNWDGSIHPW